jgi:hypothetical protein
MVTVAFSVADFAFTDCIGKNMAQPLNRRVTAMTSTNKEVLIAIFI